MVRWLRCRQEKQILGGQNLVSFSITRIYPFLVQFLTLLATVLASSLLTHSTSFEPTHTRRFSILINLISMSQNGESIKVTLRCRPLSSKEIARGCVKITEISTSSATVTVKNPKVANEEKVFTFDHAFDETSTQVCAPTSPPLPSTSPHSPTS